MQDLHNAEIYRPRTIFLQLTVLHSKLQRKRHLVKWCTIVVQGH